MASFKSVCPTWPLDCPTQNVFHQHYSHVQITVSFSQEFTNLNCKLVIQTWNNSICVEMPWHWSSHLEDLFVIVSKTSHTASSPPWSHLRPQSSCSIVLWHTPAVAKFSLVLSLSSSLFLWISNIALVLPAAPNKNMLWDNQRPTATKAWTCPPHWESPGSMFCGWPEWTCWVPEVEIWHIFLSFYFLFLNCMSRL